MISKKMAAAITKQINAELYSAYLYFAMSSACAHNNRPGAAQWLFVQGQEEMTHALRFYRYMNDVGEHVTLDAIAKPPAEFGALLKLFQAVLEHEKKVTGLIHNLAALAVAEKDYATGVMLQWFVSEQVEEEKNATEIVAKLKMAGTTDGGLYLLDKELGARQFKG